MFGKKARLLRRPSDPAPAAQDAASLELLYRHHYAWLLSQVRKRFKGEPPEDIVQEAYLRAANYQGKHVQNPRALLIHIATNVAIDRERRRTARPLTFGVGEDDAHSAASQAEALQLKQIILALPPHLREVFLLSRFGGLSYEEIAERCGIAVKTVEWRMSKALRICTEKLRG